MKKLRDRALRMILILSHLMCFTVAYEYGYRVAGIDYLGYSAPAELVFIEAFPFYIIIAGLGIVAYIANKKLKKGDNKDV